MRKAKHFLLMAAMLLCSVTSMLGDTLPVTLTKSDGLLATKSTDGSGSEQYEYTSPVYTLEEGTNTLYFTFIKGYAPNGAGLLDNTGFPFVALVEFDLYDGEGNEIPLASSNFSTNAQETSEGAISNICDDDRTTYWHSRWSGDGVGDYHRLMVTLPEGCALSEFQFRYVTRDTRQCVPGCIQVGVTPEVAPYEVSGTCGDNLTWTLNSEGNLVIEGTGSMPDFDSYADVPWSGYGALSNIILLEGVTNIGKSAFSGCSGLTTITIPESVTSIGLRAFYNCSSLTFTTLPESVTSIGDFAFYGCSGELTVNCNIPSASSNSGGAFYGSKFTKVTIGEGVTSIGGYAFHGCTSLTTITIPENSQLTSIGSNAFYDCRSLISITLPEGVTSIGDFAFYGCSGELTVNCNIPSASSNSGGAFYGSKFTKVTIGEGVTSIGDYAFYYCSSLTSIILPESVTSIGSNAFDYCTSLTSITIPEGVTSIGSYAFSCCPSLTSIVVAEGNTVYDSRGGCNAIIETSSNTLIQGCSTTIIPESVTSIGDYAFLGCLSLTSITIPEGVTSIGSNAFEYCLSLTSITIPEGVTSIGDYAFESCHNLTSITIPESVTSIGDYAFESCHSLTSITIPESVTSIGDYAFSGCSSLTSITCHAAVPPVIGAYSTFTDVDRSIPVYVPSSSVSAYNDADYWNEFTNIQPMPETITINQYGSATYCSEYALDFSEVEGLKAYAATGYKTSTGVITLTRVMTANAGVGLFLKGEPGEYTVPVLESTDENSLNMLVGTLESTEVNSTSSDGLYANFRYTIKDGDETPLFYRVDDGYTLGAGKAYLQIPVAWMPAEAKSISLRFDDGATTDIENDAELENQNSELEIYDLMGRRVSTPQRGSLYLINGKKIIY